MIDPEQVAGRWVHSHEEDSGDELVFRPAGYAFPPSRGREALTLDHGQPPTSFLRGPASVAFMRAAWPWVNMNIAASST